VHNVQDLSLINPDVEAARIAHRVGKKKRIDIIAEAKKREIFILNVQLVSEQFEEEVLPEEEKEKPEEKATTPAKKEEKPKRKPREKTKVSKKEQKPPAKKAEHPKKPQKKATAEKGAKKQ
jgi:hypothetical protein